MGFWDARLANLEAAGEVFTDAEVEVLEGGGQVLHLHPLETPDLETQDWCCYPNGDLVVVPEVCDIIAPHDLVHTTYLPSPPKVPLTAAQYLDKEYSWQGGRASWTDIPRYAGDISTMHDLHGWRCEDFTGFVYWNCWPLVTPLDLHMAQEIIAASSSMLEEGLWHQGEWLCRLAYEGDYDAADPWIFIHHPEAMKDKDRDAFIESMLTSYGNNAEEEVKIEACMWQDLFDARIVDLGGGYEAYAHNEELQGLAFPRLEDILDRRGAYETADLWRRVTARRRASLARHRTPTNYRGYTQNEVLD